MLFKVDLISLYLLYIFIWGFCVLSVAKYPYIPPFSAIFYVFLMYDRAFCMYAFVENIYLLTYAVFAIFVVFDNYLCMLFDDCIRIIYIC